MYVPKRYQEPDLAIVEALIRANDFGTLVSHDGQRPLASHLLMALHRRDGGSLVLNGHMARANPQWRTLDPTADVLAIFSGPHTYISPRWYNHVNVPTWNYMAAHVYGKPHVITDDDELRGVLRSLVNRHEADSGATPAYRLETLPEDFLVQQMKAIVGFQIDVTTIEASFKLSQNRDEQSYDNVVKELYRREDENSHAVADAMQERREKLFGGRGGA
jgi:transcriptional regulator